MNKKIIVFSTGIDMGVRNATHSSIPNAADNAKSKKGMVLPFQPLSLAFENVNYYIDMPNVNSSSHILYHLNHVLLFLTSETILCNELFLSFTLTSVFFWLYQMLSVSITKIPSWL